MMKTSHIIEIVLLSVITILLITILVLGLLDKNIFTFKISKGELLLDETYEVKDLDINIDTSSLNIHSTDDSKIRVVIYGGKEDKVEIKDNEILDVIYKRKNSFFSFGFKNYRVDVYLPNNYENNINATTTTGSVKSDAFLKNIKLKVNTGSINLDRVENVDADVDTGSVKIEEVTNKATVISDTGSIKINNLNIKEDSLIKADTGSIRINNVPDGLYIEAHANTGSIKNNAISDRFGKITLKVEAGTGSIRIK